MEAQEQKVTKTKIQLVVDEVNRQLALTREVDKSVLLQAISMSTREWAGMPQRLMQNKQDPIVLEPHPDRPGIYTKNQIASDAFKQAYGAIREVKPATSKSVRESLTPLQRDIHDTRGKILTSVRTLRNWSAHLKYIDPEQFEDWVHTYVLKEQRLNILDVMPARHEAKSRKKVEESNANEPPTPAQQAAKEPPTPAEQAAVAKAEQAIAKAEQDAADNEQAAVANAEQTNVEATRETKTKARRSRK